MARIKTKTRKRNLDYGVDLPAAKYCLANSNPIPRLAPVIKALGIAFSTAGHRS